MSAIIMVYVTTPTKAVALRIARAVVADKLAACANVLPGASSVYRWKGGVEEATECVLILKTCKTHFKKLETRIKVLHGYDVPCIVAVPVTAGHKPFLDWVKQGVL